VLGVRLGVATLLVIVCAAALGGSADSARTQGGAAWTLTPVANGQKLLRVDVSGDTLYGFRVRGTSFAVSSIKSIHASGGPAPECAITGSPPMLACDGALPGGVSVFVQLKTSGSDGAYEFALLFSPGDTNLLYVPSNQTAPPAPLGGEIGKTSAEGGRVLIQNPNSGASFQQFEIKPIGLPFTSVRTPDCALTEGGAIACQGSLRPGRTLAVKFGMDPDSDAPPVFLIAHGNATGLAYIPPGDPCEDFHDVVTRLRAEAAVVRSHLAALARVPQARRFLAPLRRKLTTLSKQIQAALNRSGNCAAGDVRKTAAAAACDSQERALQRAKGTVAGLTAVLPTERRAAAKVKKLRAVPGKTRKEIAAAKMGIKRAGQALVACDAALAQG
jgi:hypothetical protein